MKKKRDYNIKGLLYFHKTEDFGPVRRYFNETDYVPEEEREREASII